MSDRYEDWLQEQEPEDETADDVRQELAAFKELALRREAGLKRDVEWARRHPAEWAGWEAVRPVLDISFRGYDFEDFLAEVGARPAGQGVGRKDQTQGFAEGNLQWVPPGGPLESPGHASPVESKSLTTKRFAELVGRSPYTVRQLCLVGLIQATMDLGAPRTGAYRIPVSELERWRREGPIQLSRKPSRRPAGAGSGTSDDTACASPPSYGP